jgi:FixJ family two-component response regulator
VILSAFADRNNTVAALRLGAYDFLAKPFESEELEKVIMNAIETGERIQEVEMLYQRLVSQGNVDVAELKKVMDAKLEVELLKIQHHHMDKSKKAG